MSRRLAFLFALVSSASVLTAQSLTTTFASNNGGSVGGAVHFDLTVLNPSGIVIHQLDVNCANPASVPAAVDLYTTGIGGTHVGNQTNPSPGTWFLRARGSLTTAGSDNPSIATLDKPVALAVGTYGVTLAYRGAATRYTNAASQLIYANTDLQLTLGTAQNVPFSSGIFQPRIANVTVHYTVVAADTADFTADATSGSSPMVVAFADRSITPSGPATGWAWDFDDDGTVDSTQQHPTHVYPLCGDYSVGLAVTAPGGTTNVVWQDLIAVDPLAADFTANPEVGPPPLANVQFTDTSTLAATTWSWDFDGDAVPDSTAQNPIWTFGPGGHAVTLSVTNGCRSDSITRRITAATDSLATGYNANSFINRWGVVMFDLAVTSTEALSICAIDCNSLTPAGNPMAIEVFLTDGSALGKETSPGAWRRVATAGGTTPGGNQPARVILDRPILLLPGLSYGVGIYHNGNAAYYVNQSAPLSNADLLLTPVAAAYVPNGPFTVTPQFAPRQWVGELHYLKESQWPQAGITWFAPGCAGSQGVSTIAPAGTGRPLLGTTTTLQIENLPASVGFLMIGVSNTQSPFGPLPLALGPFGMTNCTAYASPDANVLVLGNGGVAQYSLSFPANGNFAGVHFYAQMLVLDPGHNALGAVVSDAVALLTGTF